MRTVSSPDPLAAGALSLQPTIASPSRFGECLRTRQIATFQRRFSAVGDGMMPYSSRSRTAGGARGTPHRGDRRRGGQGRRRAGRTRPHQPTPPTRPAPPSAWPRTASTSPASKPCSRATPRPSARTRRTSRGSSRPRGGRWRRKAPSIRPSSTGSTARSPRSRPRAAGAVPTPRRPGTRRAGRRASPSTSPGGARRQPGRHGGRADRAGAGHGRDRRDQDRPAHGDQRSTLPAGPLPPGQPARAVRTRLRAPIAALRPSARGTTIPHRAKDPRQAVPPTPRSRCAAGRAMIWSKGHADRYGAVQCLP